MLRVTLWHVPQYFQFYIQDPAADTSQLVQEPTYQHLDESGFFEGEGLVVVRVKSEYSRIPVLVEYDADNPNECDRASWDRVIECSLANSSGVIAFVGCPDGVFGELEVPAGNYHLRVHYGGQDDVRPDGETGDHYLVQIWPAEKEPVI